MVLNSLSFCLSVKLLICPSYLKEILSGYSHLGCRFFSFITLSMSCQPSWAEVFLLKDKLYLLFSLAAFNICSLCLSEVAQSCLTLCDPMDCSLSGSSVHGIFQARVLEWIAISFSRGSSRPRNRTQVSCIEGRRFTI